MQMDPQGHLQSSHPGLGTDFPETSGSHPCVILVRYDFTLVTENISGGS